MKLPALPQTLYIATLEAASPTVARSRLLPSERQTGLARQLI